MQYIPKNMPEITVGYSILPGQEGIKPEVVIYDIFVYGQEISYDLFHTILYKFEEEWAMNILKSMIPPPPA